MRLLGHLLHLWWAKHILVRFDGSLRFPCCKGFGSGSEWGMRPIAACAALMIFDDDTELFLGGKYLAGRGGFADIRGCDQSITSGQAEYEGLIFGLQHLVAVLSREKTDDILNFDANQQNRPLTASNYKNLTIQSDCKTIVQQLNGSSRPRKLERFYKQASALLCEIQRLHNSYHNSTLSVKVEHIPRSRNHICDQIAGEIVQFTQEQNYRNSWFELQRIADACDEWDIQEKKQTKDTTALKTICPVKLSSRARKMLDFWDQSAVQIVSPGRRLLFYRYIARLAVKVDDYGVLVSVGEKLEVESLALLNNLRKQRRKSQQPKTSKSRPERKMDVDSHNQNDENARNALDCVSRKLLAEAMIYQIVGLNNAGKEKQALFLDKKNTHLLRGSGHERHIVWVNNLLNCEQENLYESATYSEQLGVSDGQIRVWSELSENDEKTQEIPAEPTLSFRKNAFSSISWTTKNSCWMTVSKTILLQNSE